MPLWKIWSCFFVFFLISPQVSVSGRVVCGCERQWTYYCSLLWVWVLMEKTNSLLISTISISVHIAPWEPLVENWRERRLITEFKRESISFLSRKNTVFFLFPSQLRTQGSFSCISERSSFDRSSWFLGWFSFKIACHLSPQKFHKYFSRLSKKDKQQ